MPPDGLALFRALRDATPDTSSRRAIEKRLRAPPNGLPGSIYPSHAGPHRAGALHVLPNPSSLLADGALPSLMDLGYLLDAAARIEGGEPEPAQLDVLFAGGPSAGSALPKAVDSIDGGEWIAKLPSANNMPMIERAVRERAREAGLDVPRTRIESLPNDRQRKLIDRFDRLPLAGVIGRRHMSARSICWHCMSWIQQIQAMPQWPMRSANMAWVDVLQVIEKNSMRAWFSMSW